MVKSWSPGPPKINPRRGNRFVTGVFDDELHFDGRFLGGHSVIVQSTKGMYVGRVCKHYNASKWGSALWI